MYSHKISYYLSLILNRILASIGTSVIVRNHIWFDVLFCCVKIASHRNGINCITISRIIAFELSIIDTGYKRIRFLEYPCIIEYGNG